MLGGLILLLAGVLFLAIFTQESFLFVVFYMIAGAIIITRLWTSAVIKRVTFQREIPKKAFPGERLTARLTVQNKSLLPAVWVHLRDYYPLDVPPDRPAREVFSLNPGQSQTIELELKAYKRGYYRVGPAEISTGDVLGINLEEARLFEEDHLIVYPTVLPLSRFGLNSRNPLGTYKAAYPIYEDPSRPAGKRDYSPGDSPRRIDWKATAASGRTLVRQYDPSISLETVIFLNLNLTEYPLKTRYHATELAISAAASIASWLTENGQPVGLCTNALDQRTGRPIPFMKPSKGRANLIRILETLACCQARETSVGFKMLRQPGVTLSWGTAAILLTGEVEKDLVEAALDLKKAGLQAVIFGCGESPTRKDTQSMTAILRIPYQQLLDEKELVQARGTVSL